MRSSDRKGLGAQAAKKANVSCSTFGRRHVHSTAAGAVFAMCYLRCERPFVTGRASRLVVQGIMTSQQESRCRCSRRATSLTFCARPACVRACAKCWGARDGLQDAELVSDAVALGTAHLLGKRSQRCGRLGRTRQGRRATLGMLRKREVCWLATSRVLFVFLIDARPRRMDMTKHEVAASL